MLCIKYSQILDVKLSIHSLLKKKPPIYVDFSFKINAENAVQPFGNQKGPKRVQNSIKS